MTERDWVRVVAEERCRECGLAASHVGRADLGVALGHEAGQWATLLGRTPVERLRARPRGTWSALEYAAHTRDTLAIFGERIERVLVEDEPVLGWWDHEAAAVDERYNEQDPAEVAGALVANAARLASVLAPVDGPAWDRGATRRAGETFTVLGLARFALHEARHHRHDAEGAARG